MLKSFIKYSLPLFFAVLTMVNGAILPKIVAYSILAVYLLLIPLFLYKNGKLFLHKAFLLFIIMDLLTLLYWIMFDLSFAGFEYFAARAVTFAMISISIYYYHDYLIENYTKFLIWIGFFILLYGALTNHAFFAGRYSGPFNNPNSLGWFSALLFGITLLDHSAGRTKTFLLLFFLTMALMSGSRAAFGGIILAIFFNSQINIKNIVYLGVLIIFLIVLQQVTSSYGIHTGLERLTATEHSNEGILSGRSMEWLLAYETFLESPLTGHGLANYAFISDEVLRRHMVFRIDTMFAANPHNSFLAVLVQFGAIFAGFILLMLLYYLIKIYREGCPKKSLYFAAVYTFIASTVEAYLFSVSGFEGFVFWSTLPLCLMALHTKKIEKRKI